jgi:molecular chaperone GrpE
MKNVTEENLENQSSEQEQTIHPESELPDAGVESGDPVAQLEASLSETQDKYLRLVAEFENYKKRVSRERMEMMKTASAEMMLTILPILDDFERAVKAGSDAGQPLAEGVLLIHNKLRSSLEAV